MKEHTVFIYRVPTKENRQLMLRRPELSHGFQGRVFLRQHLRRMLQILDFLLIGWDEVTG